MKKTTVVRGNSTTLLAVGALYEFQGERFEVVELLEGNECVVQRFGSSDRRFITVTELTNGELQPKLIDELGKIPAKELKRAKKMRAAFEALEASGVVTQDKLRTIGGSLSPRLKLRQVQVYWRRYQANPSMSACVRGRKGRPRDSAHLRPIVEDKIRQAANEKFNQPEATTLNDIWSRVKELCEGDGDPVPSKDTVARRVKSMDLSLSRRRRLGPAKYKESMRQVLHQRLAEYPGREYQIDHTQADLMVLSDDRRLCLGRPWLTLVLDVFSRCVVGIFLSFTPPSLFSLQHALSTAVCNKHRLLALLGLEDLEWPFHGLPERCLTDHAKEFKSKPYLRVCAEYGIEPMWRVSKSSGGHIERLIGTMMGELHLLPGTTFSNVPKRIGYDPQARAALTLKELLRYLVAQICAYHEKCHRSLGVTPRLKWEEGLSLVPHGVLRAPPMPKFYQDFLPESQPIRQKDGIHWGGYTFNSRLLASIAVRRKVTIRVDHWDTSRILALMPNGTYVDIPRVTPVTYNIHAMERQLQAAHRAQCKAPIVLQRCDNAERHARETLKEARIATKAVQQQCSALEVPAPTARKLLPVPPASDVVTSSPALPAVTGGQGQGAVVRASRAFSTSKLRS